MRDKWIDRVVKDISSFEYEYLFFDKNNEEKPLARENCMSPTFPQIAIPMGPNSPKTYRNDSGVCLPRHGVHQHTDYDYAYTARHRHAGIDFVGVGQAMYLTKMVSITAQMKREFADGAVVIQFGKHYEDGYLKSGRSIVLDIHVLRNLTAFSYYESPSNQAVYDALTGTFDYVERNVFSVMAQDVLSGMTKKIDLIKKINEIYDNQQFRDFDVDDSDINNQIFQAVKYLLV